MNDFQRVVIIGGGFGGLYAAQSLRREKVRVTLVDRRNFHLFQPLLYQVATGSLSPANIASPLRSILKHQKNTEVLLAEVEDFDLRKRQVVLSDGRLDYDTLIVAAGAGHFYFGNDQWESFAPGLKTIEDATEIRRRILMAFEAAERETYPQVVRELLTFVVIGGGPTGVELAGALADVAQETLPGEFRTIDPATAKIILIEGSDRILHPFPKKLSQRAVHDLHNFKVEVLTNTRVTDIRPDGVTVSREGQTQEIAARTVLWGAGVKASPLGGRLAAAAGIETDRAGRVPVGSDLSIDGYPEVFVIGDLAACSDSQGNPLPGVAPVAMQQGRYVAKLLGWKRRDRTAKPFVYRDKGIMATIGRNRAVAAIGRMQLAGRLAWFAWLLVHLMFIVTFENRILIMLRWAWVYFTRQRSACLIIGRVAKDSRPGCDPTGIP
ncbi:MAG: NAD(P)/FAD-dependent oxidoreductase [Pirellulales bacterium]|nr:NAD(P)/FAD-dependent oxidoreductase [Pirellulales bacterium]